MKSESEKNPPVFEPFMKCFIDQKLNCFLSQDFYALSDSCYLSLMPKTTSEKAPRTKRRIVIFLNEEDSKRVKLSPKMNILGKQKKKPKTILIVLMSK